MTFNFPLVKVPVLSKYAALALASFSNEVPLLRIIPCRVIRLIPETIATGAAKIKGQGEATTTTCTNRLGSLAIKAAAIPIIKEIMVKGRAY